MIYISDISKNYHITSIEHYADQTVGESVCMSVVASVPHYKCGAITAKGVSGTLTRQWDGTSKTGQNLLLTSITTVQGDSGGPVIDGTQPQAFGIVTAQSTGNAMVFSSIDFVMTDMQMRLCLNPACS